jgi:manganese transport protein
MFRLPTTATAPFCPSEVQGSIRVSATSSWRSKLKQFSGPGLLIAIGYMDPGNWATDIQGGSQFGYTLLWVVVLSSVSAMFLQLLAARLGLVTGQDLAQLSRDEYGPVGRTVQWLSAEIAIVACDVAEVLGSALAFKLLLGVPIAWGMEFPYQSIRMEFTVKPSERRKGPKTAAGLRHECPIEQNRHANPSFLKL